MSGYFQSRSEFYSERVNQMFFFYEHQGLSVDFFIQEQVRILLTTRYLTVKERNEYQIYFQRSAEVEKKREDTALLIRKHCFLSNRRDLILKHKRPFSRGYVAEYYITLRI